MIKMIAKRLLTFVLIAVLLLGFVPAIEWQSANGEHHVVDNPLLMTALAAETITPTGSSNWAAYLNISGSNTYSANNGSIVLNGNEITVKATGYATGGCNSSDEATTTTLTLKATTAIQSITFTNTGLTTTYTGGTIAANNSVTFTITSGKGASASATGKLVISSIELPVASYTTTFAAATNGSYTAEYNGSNVSVPGSHTGTNDHAYILTATPAKGYNFDKWVDGSNGVLSTAQSFDYTATGNRTIRPIFEPDPLGQIAVLNSDDPTLSKYDVAEYYSYYEPANYTHVTGVESGSHPSNTATALNYNSYEGVISSGNGKYKQRDMENVSWSVSGSSIKAERSGTSYGDNSGYSNKDGSVKTNAKVLRIHATQTINVSFDYSVTEWMEDADDSISNGRQIAFIYSLITDSAAPNLTALKSGTSWGGTTSSFLEDASHSGHFEETISAGQYLYLWICGYGYSYTSGSNNGAFGYSFSAAVSNVVIRPEARTFNFRSGSIDGAGNMIGSGKISINNTDYTVGGNGQTSVVSNLNGSQHVSLAVKTVPTGYTHIGWRIVDNGTSTDVFTSTYEFNIESDSTVYALFSPKITVTAGGTNGFGSAAYQYKNPSGTEVTGANQYIARNSDGTVWYKDLGTAFSAQSTVVLVTNVVLSGDFTVPSGKTLSVPYSLDDVATTDLQRESGSGSISSYVTLTVADSLTISGNLVASARQEQSTSGYGRIFGKAGYIRVDGSMSVSGTGKVYAYGMIVGTGTISVASGGYVYELLEIRDMRAIQAMMDAYDHGKAFPFNNFFIKNIEVPTTYASGSYLKAKYYVNVSGITADGEIPVIAKSTDNRGMFKIASGSLTKAFSSASPYNNKIIFRVENGGNVQTGSFAISMTATIAGFSQDVNVDTTNYILPLGYGYAIEVENGGSFTVNDNYKILPGGMVNVKEGGTLTIASGKKLVLYRANDYDFRKAGSAATGAQGFCSTGYPTAFTKPADLTYATNSAANVGSAKLNVDGTVVVNGGLYVTNQLTENTPYSNGYNSLTGTGEIRVTNALSNGTIDEETQQGNDTTSSVTVIYVPIKGITNYDATSDDGQTDYNSLTPGTWYGYINDSDVNVWSTTAPAILSYDANGGTGDAPAPVRKPAGSTFTVAANGFTAPEGKEFVGWNTVQTPTAEEPGVAYAPDDVVTLSEDTTLYAQWSTRSFVPTFVLNEAQYAIYQRYTNETITDTVLIDDVTYYVVDQADAALEYGSEYTAPTAAAMGVTGQDYGFEWKLSADGGEDTYQGTVPEGAVTGEAVYIYGFYWGYVAKNLTTNQSYKTLAAAIEAISEGDTCTVQLIRDCDSFEPVSGTTVYTIPASSTVTLDLNGYKALGRIENNGTLTLDLNGGTWEWYTGVTTNNENYNSMAAIINNGSLTVQDTAGEGKLTTDVNSNGSGATNSSAIRNNSGARLTITGGTIETTESIGTKNAGVLNVSGGTILDITGGTIQTEQGVALYNLGSVTRISGGTFTNSTKVSSGIYNAPDCSIDTIGTDNGGPIAVGLYGINNAGTIKTISGGTFTGKTNGIQNTGSITNAVSGVTATGGTNGISNAGTIKTISGGTISGANGINNSGSINTIGGTCSVTASKAGTSATNGGAAIYNTGAITQITGGSFTTTATYCHALFNTTADAAIDLISGGVFSTKNANAICNNKGTITTIDGGDFRSDYSCIYNLDQATIVTISGGKFESTNYLAFLNCASVGTISGGLFIANKSDKYALQNGNSTYPNATIEKIPNVTEGDGGITGGIFKNTKSGGYAVYNYTSNPILVSGGDFKGGTSGREYAIRDYASKFTYPEGKELSTGTETVTLPSGSTDNGYHYITNKKYTVTFDTGDYCTAPDALTNVEHGSTITAPAAPVAEGFDFVGWYKESTYENAWDFATDTVTENTTLFAKWTASAISITEATVNVSGTYTFTGNPIIPETSAITVTLGDASLTYGTDYTFVVSNNTNAGTATVTVTGTGSYKDTATGTFTIGKATVEVPTISSKPYNGSTQTADVPESAVYTVNTNAGGINVGNYNVILELNDASNYKWSDSENAIKNLNFEITKAVPTAADFDFAAPSDLGYNNTAKEATVIAKYGVTGMGDITVKYYQNGEVVTSAIAAGTYTVKIDVTEGANYSSASALTAEEWTFTIETRYTVLWKNYDGTLLLTNYVEPNTMPNYNGETPTKDADAQYTYTFAGWDPVIEPATADATYTAQFTQTVNKYTVTWKNWDDTVLKTDENVEYGTMPAYTGDAPTKTDEGAQYTYAFVGWNPAVAEVTGDATYTAQFNNDKVYKLTFKYQTSADGTPASGGTIKLTVNEKNKASIAVPKMRYYDLTQWKLTVNGNTDTYTIADYKTDSNSNADAAALAAEALSAAAQEALKSYAPSDITVTTVFVRQTYVIEIWNVVGNSSAAYQEKATVSVGKSIWVNAQETIDGYNFAYWTIGTPTASTEEDKIFERKTSYFVSEKPAGNVIFYAHYTSNGGGTTVDTPKVTVRDYFVEHSADGISYVVGMTLEVIAPTDTSNFSIYKEDGKYQVGFGYTTIEDKAKANDFATVLSGNWGSEWTSGTYVKRFTIPSVNAKLFSYGFIKYMDDLDGVEYPATRFATYNNPNTASYTGYDIMTVNGLEGRNG